MDRTPLGLRRPVAPLPVDRAARVTAPSHTGPRIGLLGGSFNPAHEGHVHISCEALRRLALDQVWWLVAPQNPLKPTAGMAPFAERMARATAMASHPRIVVSDIEARFGTRYSVDTLERLKARGGARFVWLIGADNMVQLPKWHRWQRLLELAPVAVFDRSPYSCEALCGLVARRYARARWPGSCEATLVDADPPAWMFVRLRRHGASSTAIRRMSA